MENINIVAVLSTTILPLDGLYRVTRLETIPNIEGVQHYIGHPDTKNIVEQFGSIQSESKLFLGLQVGESAVTFAIKQGMSNRIVDGFTTQHQEVTSNMLDIRLVTRW